MEWINVDDRLPDMKKDVFVTDGRRHWVDSIDKLRFYTKYEKDGSYSNKREYPYFYGLDPCDWCHGAPAHDITHWKELPVLPQNSNTEHSIDLWISVVEKIPQDTRDVLVTNGKNCWVDFQSGPAKFIKYKKDGSRYYEYNYFTGVQGCGYCEPIEISGVTHWMELPDYPSAKDNNGMD